ncbi:hypothetical protein D3C72_502610 [compost metagenome]
MRSLFVLVSVMLLAACAPSAVPPVANPAPSIPRPSMVPTSSPSPGASSVPSPVVLDGTWLISEHILSGLPKSDACDGYVVTLEQTQGQVHWRRSTGWSQVEEEATGALEGDRLVLHGTALVGLVREPVTYDLAFDRAAGTLRGKREGRGVTVMRDETRTCQSNMPTVAVRGWVYDEQGHPVPGAQVIIRSLNPSNPFELRLTAGNGSYVAYRVPTGVSMSVETEKLGMRPQRRDVQFRYDRLTSGPRVHFGGPATPEDTDAPSYPLIPDTSPSPAN